MDQLDAKRTPPSEAALVGATSARQARKIEPMTHAT